MSVNPSYGYPQFPRWPLPANPFTEAWQDTPDAKEQRELRDRAVGHAAYIHGDVNVMFERAESVVEVLKSAQEIYDWILNGGEQ